jgi:hypothetical protein
MPLIELRSRVFSEFGFRTFILAEPETSYLGRVDTSMFCGLLCSVGEQLGAI